VPSLSLGSAGTLRFNPLPPTRIPPAGIAVLSGARKGSSGEIALSVVRDRRRARTFGPPTAGLTTANGRYRLSNGMTLYLAVASVVSSRALDDQNAHWPMRPSIRSRSRST